MEFEGFKFKYENDKLWKQNKIGNQHGKKGDWICCNNLKATEYGYIRIKLNKKMYRLHRLVYKLHNTSWDIYDTSRDNSIDHIDRDKNNNKIENLRVATNSLNKLNSNAKGYYYNKVYNKYCAEICINHNRINLGYYDTEEEANLTYLNYKKHKIKK